MRHINVNFIHAEFLMSLHKKSKISGDFSGWGNGNVYELSDGTKWLQIGYEFVQKYKAYPKVKIRMEGCKYMMEIRGMDKTTQVRRILPHEKPPYA